MESLPRDKKKQWGGSSRAVGYCWWWGVGPTRLIWENVMEGSCLRIERKKQQWGGKADEQQPKYDVAVLLRLTCVMCPCTISRWYQACIGWRSSWLINSDDGGGVRCKRLLWWKDAKKGDVTSTWFFVYAVAVAKYVTSLDDVCISFVSLTNDVSRHRPLFAMIRSIGRRHHRRHSELDWRVTVFCGRGGGAGVLAWNLINTPFSRCHWYVLFCSIIVLQCTGTGRGSRKWWCFFFSRAYYKHGNTAVAKKNKK